MICSDVKRFLPIYYSFFSGKFSHIACIEIKGAGQTHRLLHPRYMVKKVYDVIVQGELDPSSLSRHKEMKIFFKVGEIKEHSEKDIDFHQ